MARTPTRKTRGPQPPKPKRGQRPRRPFWRALVKWGVVAAVWGMLAAGALVAYYAYDLPRVADVPALERRAAVTLLSADGTPFARFGEAAGRPVTVAELPRYVPQAVLATEDTRFYSHFGLDLLGLARAALVNLYHGRVRQGGSTITQQLAKNLFFGPERTIKRKVQETLMALWLERRFTKDEILALYLNRVYFGGGNFGIEAAAQSYFGKTARALALNEAAMLAGLLKAPSRYAPTNDPDRAAERAAIVLDRMADAGFITEAQAKVVKLNPARLGRQQVRIARYFADWTLELVRGYVGAGGGDLTVLTTLDLRLQQAVEAEAAALLLRAGKARDVTQAAAVVLAPDGAVRAMTGGVDYGRSQFNRATQAQRQPGSAFKPFVFLAGLDAGLNPGTVLDDAPVTLGNFTPRNYEGVYHGRVTMLDALARSLNSVAVRVLERAGIERVINWARRLGIVSPLKREAGLALGASEVTLLELVAAYAPFANGGDGVFAHAVVEVRDSAGTVLYRRGGSGPGSRVPAGMLADMNRMLEAVIARGTGRAAQIPFPAAGKTGTTQDHRDAWFIGYTAEYVAGIWMGNDDGRPMKGVTGGGLPADLWRAVMLEAHRGLAPKALPSGPPGGFWSRLFGGGIQAEPASSPERPRSTLRVRD